MFIIGIVLMLLILIFAQETSSRLFLLISYGIPLIFYFYRNKTDLKEAIIVSFAFGFVFTVVFNLLTILLAMYPIIPDLYDSTFLLPSPETLFLYISVASIISAILTLIYGLIIWFAVKKLKWEKS